MVLSNWRSNRSSAPLTAYFPYDQKLINYVTHISDRHRVVYVETPKAGCTTVKRVLQIVETGSEDGLARNVHERSTSPLKSPETSVFSPEEIYASPEIFRFCIVRNPYTRVVSAYLDKLVTNKWEARRRLPRLGFTPDAEITLLQFLQTIARQESAHMDIHWMPQAVLLQPDKVRYDVIGRLEKFDADFAAIMQRVAPAFLDKYSTFDYSPHRTGAAQRIAELVGPEEEKLIRQIYADDFRVFGYDLAQPASGLKHTPHAALRSQSKSEPTPCRIPADVRIVLHIGQMKTGTTALQEAMQRHRNELLNEGILYPKTGVLPRHSDLAWSYWPPAQLNGWVKSKHNSKSSQAIIDEIESEILDTGAKSVVISAEEFSLRPVQLYRSLLQRWRNNLHIVVYLRRQDEMIESMYKQNVLNQAITTPFADYVEAALDPATKLGRRLNYGDFLAEWEAIVDRKNIHVSPYDSETKIDLWGNFVCTTQLKCSFDVQLEKINDSLHPEFIEFLRRTNVYIPKLGRHKIITDITWLQKALKIDSKILCHDKLRQRILANFAEQNRVVALRYLDRSEFFKA